MARDVLTIAYLGLGSNVGDRQRHLRRALELLDARGALRVAAVSSVYETQAWGNTEQEPFLN
ncbi:MAG: 2-amino-4-hydroxy-6-hydroxymethyldihydropteridine diphosphokinase, partial [Armatimonadota bacterium]